MTVWKLNGGVLEQYHMKIENPSINQNEFEEKKNSKKISKTKKQNQENEDQVENNVIIIILERN